MKLPPVRDATHRLPDGFVVRLRADLSRADGGRVLVGGSPARAMRLSARAVRMLDGSQLQVRDEGSAVLARRLMAGNLADPVLDRIPAADSLTVVVPVRDRAEQLERCLAALTGLPVVVVDDASQDPAAVAAVAQHHGAAVVSLAANVGPGGARNAGLARVETELVAFVDSDVVAEASELLSLARHCVDPQVALVGPSVVGKVRSARPRWFERYDAAASSLDLGSRAGQVRPGAAIGWLPAACLVGRASHLRAAGGFAPELRVAEDVDLVWRLVRAGLVVRYEPAVRVRHDVRATLRGWLGRKYLYGTGGADLGLRHGDKIAPAVLSPLMAAGAAALLQRRWWSAPVAAVTLILTTRKLRRSLPVESGRTVVAAELSFRGLGWAVRQESGLLLRHWWPLGLLAALMGRTGRRALLSAVLVDTFVFCRERTGVSLPTILVARRLDDLAYGAGLWRGAVRRRDTRCLLPRWSRAQRR